MSSLILPNKWTRQPQTPVGIDWGNPLTKSLAAAISSISGTNLVNNVPVNGLSGAGVIPTPNNGLVADFIGKASTSNVASTFEPSSNATGRTYFIPFLRNGAGGGNFGRLFAKGAADCYLMEDVAVNVFAFVQNGVGQRTFAPPGGLSGTVGWHTLAVTIGSDSSIGMYLDAVPQSLTAVNGYSTSSATTPFALGNRPSDNARVWNGQLGNLYIFDRVLLPAEIRQLNDNQWQIFKAPARRLWVTGAGGLTLSPSLYVDPDTFYSPTVSPGAVTLSPSLFADADTFYAATVTPGAIALSPSLIVDADTFYAATVIPGGVNLAPALLSSTNTFYSPTVSTGSVNISPALFTDSDTFYSPTVSLAGSPQTLTPSLFVDADTFHSATVAAGGVTLNPSLFVDADTFYIPTVSLDGAPQNLTPSLYIDSDTFYSPTVSSSGSQNLLPSLFVDADIFYPFSMVNGGFAKRGEYENDQSARRTHIQESKRSNIQTSRRR